MSPYTVVLLRPARMHAEGLPDVSSVPAKNSYLAQVMANSYREAIELGQAEVAKCDNRDWKAYIKAAHMTKLAPHEYDLVVLLPGHISAVHYGWQE